MENKFELLQDGANRLLKINAIKGEKYKFEAGAMVAMTPTFDMKTRAGGLGKMVGRMFAGESAFIQEYTANSEGELLLAPHFAGDISVVSMDGYKNYRIGKSSFLAATEDIDVRAKNGGFKGILSGEGLIQLEASGQGTLFVSSTGGIYKKVLGVGERYIVDSDHLVLWDSNMKYTIEILGGLATSILGGEGLVAKFEGPGEIWIQTRKPIIIPTETKK